MTTTVLTAEQFKMALPEKVRKNVSQELMDTINNVVSEPELYEAYRENLMSYTKIMQDGRFSLDNYLNAVMYVSHKMMGNTNIQAYSKTFPDKITRFKATGVSDKDVSSYCTAYNKSKLVNLIFAQTLVPSYILNQDLYQKALNVQADLMLNAKSEKVQTDAANSLLTHLKMPESTKVEMDITVKEDGSIAALRRTTLELAKVQRQAIERGHMNAQDIANGRLHMVDIEDAVITLSQPRDTAGLA
jgi:hypothetical protein